MPGGYRRHDRRIEFHPAVLKVGRTLAFADCRVISSGRLIARASASFRMISLQGDAADEAAAGPST